MHRAHFTGTHHGLSSLHRTGRLLLLLLAIAAICSPRAHAAVVIEANPPPSTFEHIWAAPIPPQAPLGSAFDNADLSLPKDIDATGENTFRIDIPAPDGQQFAVTRPDDIIAFLYMTIVYSGDGFALGDAQDYTFAFDTTSGTAPSTAQANITSGNSGFRIELRWAITDSRFTFTGLTTTVNFTGFGPGNFSTDPGSSLFGLVSHSTTDPGPLLALEPIPEPSTSLLALSALGLTIISRRKKIPAVAEG